MSLTARYLTPEGKADVLAQWERWKADSSSIRPSEDKGGHGYVDPEVFDLCDQINALEDWCTLQSCYGHRYPAPEDPEVTVTLPGQFWLWPTERAALAFYRRVGELVASPFIDQVAFLWGREREREVVEVFFVGHEHFAESSEAIMSFLRALNP